MRLLKNLTEQQNNQNHFKISTHLKSQISST